MCFHTTPAFDEGEGKKLFITQHLSVPLFIAFFCALKSHKSIYLNSHICFEVFADVGGGGGWGVGGGGIVTL